jgi:PAS domain S-box-containing protein
VGIALAAALDDAHDCVTLLDRDGRIRYANQAIAALHRHQSPDALIGESWIDQWNGDVRDIIAQAIASSRLAGAARTTIGLGAEGTSRWLELTITRCGRGNDEGEDSLVIARDITADVIARGRHEAIAAEMAHRLKNAMAVAAGLTSMSARGHPDRQEFAKELSERFSQLGMVQGMVLSGQSELSLAQIVPILSTVYGGASTLEFGSLPDVLLSSTAVQALALTFGELATNSLKYGALKSGRPIRIDATTAGQELHVTWREETAFAGNRDGGQGIGLIERIVRANGGTFSRDIEPGQLIARLAIPVLASS